MKSWKKYAKFGKSHKKVFTPKRDLPDNEARASSLALTLISVRNDLDHQASPIVVKRSQVFRLQREHHFMILNLTKGPAVAEGLQI